MAQLVSTRWVNRPAAAGGLASDLKTAVGTFEYGATSSPAAGDTIIMCKVPRGALIIGGALTGDAIEESSAGSGLLSINIGIDKAIITQGGTTYGTTSTSNALASSWNLGSDTLNLLVNGIPTGGKRNIPLGSLLYSEGPLYVTDEANVYITVTSSTFRTTTGTLVLRVDYLQQQHA